MLAIKTILHPTDFSAPSDAAFRLAYGLARDHRSRLVVLHVVPAPESHGELVARRQGEGYHEDLWRMLEGVRPEGASVAVERRLEDGSPAETIVKVAREEGADLIVLGTQGRTGLARLVLGSVAERVVRLAPCPVLTTSATPLQPAEGGSNVSNRGGVS
jgi:nucleotide-binding universal stress UspA family protein